jgi:hypothetical protein
MTDLGSPPDELRDLLAAERDVSAADRAAIRTRLATSIAAPPAATTSLVASKALWFVAGALVAAGVWWYVTRGPSQPPSEAPALAPPTPVERIDVHQATVAPAPAPPPAPAPDREAPAAAPSQADLLAQAWQALGKNDPTATLQLLDTDRRLHPDGALSEEREAMHVQALAAAGHMVEARTEAEAFRARYPHSVHRAAIDKVVPP